MRLHPWVLQEDSPRELPARRRIVTPHSAHRTTTTSAAAAAATAAAAFLLTGPIPSPRFLDFPMGKRRGRGRPWHAWQPRLSWAHGTPYVSTLRLLVCCLGGPSLCMVLHLKYNYQHTQALVAGKLGLLLGCSFAFGNYWMRLSMPGFSDRGGAKV